MKTAISILIFTLFINSSALSQWSKVPGPYGGEFTDIERVGSEIWLSSISGLYISQNEGLTWQKSNLIDKYVYDVICYNDTIVILFDILNGPTKVNSSISSFDGGNSWSMPTVVPQGTIAYKCEKLIKASKVLFAIGSNKRSKSIDGGLSWTYMPNNFDELTTDGQMALGTIIGSHVTLVYSIDGNTPWTVAYSQPNVYYEHHQIINDCFFLQIRDLVADNYKWLRSCDLGNTWNEVITDSSFIPLFPSWLSEDTLLVNLQNPPSGLISTDNGDTWQSCPVTSEHLIVPGIKTTSGNRIILYHYKDVFTFVPNQNLLIPTNTGTSAHAIECLYTNKNKLFAATKVKDFYKSADNGLTWQKITNQSVLCMAFQGDSAYALIGAHPKLLKSYNNGLTWDSLPISNLNYLGSYDVRINMCKHKNNLFIGCYQGIFVSSDEGLTWNLMPQLPLILNGCQNSGYGGLINIFYDNLYAFSERGLFKYDSTAQNWQTLYSFCTSNSGTEDYLSLLSNKIIVSRQNKLYVSSDSGSSFTYNNPNAPDNILEFGGAWFGVDGFKQVLYSTNEGILWQLLDPDSTFQSDGEICIMNNVIYADAYYDGIYRRTNSLFSLQGNVFLDTNNDGFKNNGEVGINQILMTVNPASYTATTNALGDYLLVTDMSGSISPASPTPFASITPPIFNYTGQTDSVDFAIHLPANIFDLKADVTNTNVFNPGFETSLQLTISNYGNTISNASAKLIIDTSVDFISSIPSPTLVSGDTLFWNLSTLNFLDQTTIQVIVETTVGTPIGSVVTFSLEAIPVIGDTLPLDNFSAFEAVVVGSFDPNDKTCLQGEIFTPAQLQNNTPLEYIIRFQNTGNFPTSFVIIQDTLSNLLDLSTFKFISSSHACRWSIDGQGILIITFNPLALPPESSDPLNSNGFFKYSIKCKNGIDIGSAIDNKASIIFDFNPAIVTNTVTTLISNPIPLQIPELTPTIVSLLPFPNPSKEFITIKNLEFNGSNEIYALILNSQGLYIQTIPISISEPMLDISQLKSGLYFSKLISKEGKVLGKIRFIKVN